MLKQHNCYTNKVAASKYLSEHNCIKSHTEKEIRQLKNNYNSRTLKFLVNSNTFSFPGFLNVHPLLVLAILMLKAVGFEFKT